MAADAGKLAAIAVKLKGVKANTKPSCPLYPFDAADEKRCVDLGGRPTIYKKKK